PPLHQRSHTQIEQIPMGVWGILPVPGRGHVHKGHGPPKRTPAKPQGGRKGAGTQHAPERLDGLSRGEPDGHPVDPRLWCRPHRTASHSADDSGTSTEVPGAAAPPRGTHSRQWDPDKTPGPTPLPLGHAGEATGAAGQGSWSWGDLPWTV